MKTAIIYTRVSTDDQADYGFSLSNQKNVLETYCNGAKIEIIKHFREDYSAKDFNRPEFNKLTEFIKIYKGKIDFLLFTKWDRFSRNLEGSLRVIRDFKKKGIECVAIEQPYDLSNPDHKLALSISLTLPEIENDKIALRTLEGMRRARIEGCWMGVAPIGYKNHRDVSSKSTLVFSDKAPLIKESFEIFAKGVYSIEEVRRRMFKKGLKISKNQFHLMLQNVVYAGKISVSAYGKEEGQIIKGLHEGIVSEELFNKVQNLIKSNRKQPINKVVKRDELPLRGFLTCPKCGGNLTGSGSKSRSGEKHYYYHCQKGCTVRFRADLANDAFETYLSALEIDEPILKLYKAIMKDIYKRYEGDNEIEISKLRDEKKKLEDLKNSATDKFLANELEKGIYNNTISRYDRKTIEINSKIAEMNLLFSGYSKYLNEGLPLLCNLSYYYKCVPIELKQKLIGSIFPEKLIFEEKKYRTTKMNEVLNLILSNNNGFGDMAIKKGQQKCQPFLLGSPGRT